MIDVICTDGTRRIVLSFPIGDPGVEQHWSASGDLTTARLVNLLNNSPMRGPGLLSGLYTEEMTAYNIIQALEIIGLPADIPPVWEAYFVDEPDEIYSAEGEIIY